MSGKSQPTADDEVREPGEQRRGWQRVAATACELAELERIQAAATPTAQARLRSCAGPRSGQWLAALPTEAALAPHCPLFRFCVARRLGLPVLPLLDACEGCGTLLDEFGYHRATCMRTGRVHARHRHLVQAWRRVLTEAGVSVPDRNVERLLRHTHTLSGG